MEYKEKSSLKYILYTIFAIVLIWCVYGLFVFIYANGAGIIAFASAAGTVWAAMATWRAAEKAAESAQIARDSMDATVILGRQTLEEAQRANKLTAFENRYAVLLAQHAQYHSQLCDYLDTAQLNNRKYDNNEKIESGLEEIHNFFNKSINAPTLDSCFSFLTGHEIISRYMRTLYHLLKFVSQECVFNNIKDVRNQKNYISPVRSTIRNDVLLLIAVNALNVLDQRAKESSYPYYQQLLHKFDFFEHAIFMFPLKPNELFKHNDWVKKIQIQILKAQSDFVINLTSQQGLGIRSFKIPTVEFRSPLMMAIIIFKNPMRESAITALHTLPETWDMSQAIENAVKNALESYRSSKKTIDDISNFEIQADNATSWGPIKEEIISTIKKEAFKQNCHYDGCIFRNPNSEYVNNLKGSDLRSVYRVFERNRIVANKIEKLNGIEGYMRRIPHMHTGRLKRFFREINRYKVENGHRELQK